MAMSGFRRRDRMNGTLASVFGALSGLTTIAGFICVCLGPFSCLLSWVWAFYIFLAGVPLQLFSLLFANLALRAIRRNPRLEGALEGAAVAHRAITVSSFGLLVFAVWLFIFCRFLVVLGRDPWEAFSHLLRQLVP
jgi:hypothetical protein